MYAVQEGKHTKLWKLWWVTRLKMAILGHPLDYTRDELNPEMEGTSVRIFF